jgi:hypothetical protein
MAMAKWSGSGIPCAGGLADAESLGFADWDPVCEESSI